ncbi:MAG: class I SAM-dependent methyltransferase [Myxococcota bacterium]|nr:class I SAM-dependent methyltransferase [Myxococcota bacterium]
MPQGMQEAQGTQESLSESVGRVAQGFEFSDFRARVTLDDVPEVPGMIAQPTQAYYKWLTSESLAGRGAVVEIGTFLGRSTVHLAAGLRLRRDEPVLHCFDRFVWRPEHADTVALPLQAGESFEAIFLDNVRAVYPNVRTHAGEIRDIAWSGEPIELLVLDAPKQLPDLSTVLSVFGPSLLEGGRIVLEDFLYFPAYPIACVLSRLGDVLAYEHVVDRSHTVALRVEAPLACGDAQPLDWDPSRWSPAEVRARWDAILEPLPEPARRRLAPGRWLHLHDLGAVDEACAGVRGLDLNRDEQALWERLAQTHLHDRYAPLFAALGLRRRFDPRRPKDRTRARRELRRAWRRAYLGSRRFGRRMLDAIQPGSQGS